MISFHAVSIDDKAFARRFLDRFEIYGVRFSNGFKLDTVLWVSQLFKKVHKGILVDD